MFKLKAIALNKYKTPVQSEEDLIDFLKMWWSNKYNLPDNHPLFLDKTVEEHVIDYYMDRFYKNPDEANAKTVEELAEEDAKLKAEYGDDFVDDYYIPPSTEEKGEEIIGQLPEEFDEKFDTSEGEE